MNKQLPVLTSILLLSTTWIFSQNTSYVIFKMKDSNNAHLLSIYEPIDKHYNAYVKSIEHRFRKGKSTYAYKGQLSETGIILCKIDNKNRFYIIPPINDTLAIDIYPERADKDGISFSKASARLQKWYNDYMYMPFVGYDLAAIFDSDSTNYVKIPTDVNEFISHALSSLDSLQEEIKNYKTIYELIKDDMLSAIYEDAIEKYHFILKGDKYGKLPYSDSMQVLENIQEIYTNFPPLLNNKLRLVNGDNYIVRYARFLDAMIVNRTITGLGPYNCYGVLPDKYRMPLLGEGILVDYLFQSDEINKDTAMALFTKMYPKSEYLPILKKLQYQDLKASSMGGKQVKDIYIDTSTTTKIHSIYEFHEEYFKHKKLLIDLWSTACIPCIQQFEYNQSLEKLAKHYQVSLGYISFDDFDLRTKWIKDIYWYNLKGVHLRASEALQENIQKEIYGNEPLSIPRYIYLNKEGVIIHKNAARPNFINEIEEMFLKK